MADRPGAVSNPDYAADMLALLAQLHAQAPMTTLDWVGTSMGGLIGMVVSGQPGCRSPCPFGVWCSMTWAALH
jgi:predicted alpha/beta hydrolase